MEVERHRITHLAVVVQCLLLRTLATAGGQAPAAGTAWALAGAHTDRRLQQLPSPATAYTGGLLWGAPPGTCGVKPLVLVYGAAPPSSISDLLAEMPPIPQISVKSADDVELVSIANASSSCLAATTRIPGSLAIYDDGTIPNLSALARLRQVDGQVVVWGVNSNAALTDMRGLDSLQSVGGLSIAHASRMRDLSGLSRLNTIVSDLVIFDNQGLESLTGMGNVSSLFNRLVVDSNDRLTDLRGLQSLAQVGYDVVVQHNRGLQSLRGLEALAQVDGELAIFNNPQLTTTANLVSLRSVGISVVVASNDALQDLSGLRALKTVNGDLNIANNLALPSLAGVENVTTVKLALVVNNNNALTSLAGLDNVRSVGNLLAVMFNDNLASMQGLGALSTVGQDMIVADNPALTSLAGLTSLRSVGADGWGDLIVRNNPRLADAGELATQVTHIGGFAKLEKNALPAAEVAALQARANKIAPGGTHAGAQGAAALTASTGAATVPINGTEATNATAAPAVTALPAVATLPASSKPTLVNAVNAATLPAAAVVAQG